MQQKPSTEKIVYSRIGFGEPQDLEIDLGCVGRLVDDIRLAFP
jgi:hypothetical protein